MSARVGVIGLGAMGFPMASVLLASNFEVLVYSRSRGPVDKLVTLGARPAADPVAMGAAVDFVVLSLPGADDVRGVLLGDGGVVASARPGTIVIDTSTLSPTVVRNVAAELAEAGVGYIDAPVSGGPSAAETGTLSLMIGGTDEHVSNARVVLTTIGSVITHCGGVGAGQICKACNQLIVMGTIELVAETLVLAERAGLQPQVVRNALLGGYASSRVLEVHGQRMIDRDFAPGGKARFNVKDIENIRELARDAGTDLPAFAATAKQIEQLLEAGGADLDNSAMVTIVEENSSR